MIRTKFTTEDLTAMVEMLHEFEDKLTYWSAENANATWDVEVQIGNYEYFIIVTVENEEIAIPIDSVYKYFQFWNGIFKLTAKELEVLHAFVECSNNLKNLCTLDDKKCVATALNIKDKNTLNNYIKKLKKTKTQ